MLEYHSLTLQKKKKKSALRRPPMYCCTIASWLGNQKLEMDKKRQPFGGPNVHKD